MFSDSVDMVPRFVKVGEGGINVGASLSSVAFDGLGFEKTCIESGENHRPVGVSSVDFVLDRAGIVCTGNTLSPELTCRKFVEDPSSLVVMESGLISLDRRKYPENFEYRL